MSFFGWFHILRTLRVPTVSPLHWNTQGTQNMELAKEGHHLQRQTGTADTRGENLPDKESVSSDTAETHKCRTMLTGTLESIISRVPWLVQESKGVF